MAKQKLNIGDLVKCDLRGTGVVVKLSSVKTSLKGRPKRLHYVDIRFANGGYLVRTFKANKDWNALTVIVPARNNGM